MKYCWAIALTLAYTVASLSHSDTMPQGGGTSVMASSQKAFSLPAQNMPMASKLDFHVGNSFFRNPWVIAPASTTARDGLGPLFNTNACQNCHIRDGRGHAPEYNAKNNVSLLLRLSIPNHYGTKQQLETQGLVPEPVYGDQLQDFAIPNAVAEGQINIRYTERNVQLADGETITLRKPHVTITDLGYGPMHPETLYSVRIAPAMIGLGLLAAIDESTLEQLADADDKNADGISGKLNKVWDKQTASTRIGRFGWKAGQPTLEQQNAAAFNGDMGLTTTLNPNENCSSQQDVCKTLPNGGSPEVEQHILDQVTFYTHNLAVPVQRNTNNPKVIKGREYFFQAGCENCHKAKLTTGDFKYPWLANQQISPYTDLLLHDMGPELADQRPEFLALGREWRTAPLWGIGLTQIVANHATFLHDGRARNLTEAILWHGGEAEQARENFKQLNKSQREALITFLQSL